MEKARNAKEPHAGEKPISAKAVGMTVTYAYQNGDTFKIHGKHPVRDNNPGNVISGPIARKNGSISRDGRFAIFATAQDGWGALNDLLTKTYVSKKLDDVIVLYAPPTENKTAHYQQEVSKLTGIPGDTVLAKLDRIQVNKLMAVIGRLEGWKGEAYAQ